MTSSTASQNGTSSDYDLSFPSGLPLDDELSACGLPTWTDRQADFDTQVNDRLFDGKADRTVLDFANAFCDRNGLDPLAGHVYAIERRLRGDDGRWKTVWEIAASVHGWLAIADRTGELDGVTDKAWCGPDGRWVDIWLADDPPAAARCLVHRKGRRPVEGKVTWKSFARLRAGAGHVVVRDDGLPMSDSLWETSPPDQLMKCALSLALRQAFPSNPSFKAELMASATVAPADDHGADHAPEPPTARRLPPNRPPGPDSPDTARRDTHSIESAIEQRLRARNLLSDMLRKVFDDDGQARALWLIGACGSSTLNGLGLPVLKKASAALAEQASADFSLDLYERTTVVGWNAELQQIGQPLPNPTDLNDVDDPFADC